MSCYSHGPWFFKELNLHQRSSAHGSWSGKPKTQPIRAFSVVYLNFCLDSEHWYLVFTYLFFKIYFLMDSLLFSPFHLNIISSFILYSLFILFLTTTHLSTFFDSIVDYYNKKYIWSVNSKHYTVLYLWRNTVAILI